MEDIKKFSNIGKFKIYKPGEVLFLQDTPGDCMFIVNKGAFSVYINTFTDFPMKVADITEGAFMGEMSVIDGSPRSATVISDEQGIVISIDKEHFRDLLNEHHDIAEKILSTLYERAESTAALARERGNKVAEIPAELKNASHNADTGFDAMLYFAQRIRELNELLYPKREARALEAMKAAVNLKLLPEGHHQYTEIDKMDNSKLLSAYDVVCPYCGKGFKGQIPIFTRLHESRRMLDGRVTYSNFNILFYTNIICPNCNYCDTYHEFLKESEEPLTLKAKGNQFPNKEGFTGYKREQTHTFHEVVLSYYLSIECLKRIPDSELRIAKAWQRLCWIYRDYRDYRAEKWALYAAKEAVSGFTKFLEAGGEGISAENRLTMSVIAGELYAALGNTEKAKNYLNAATNIIGVTSHELAVKAAERLKELGN